MNAFQVLGIAPTKDKKEIKKTYARLTKKYHPEEEPAKWQEIYNAYSAALKWAENEESYSIYDNISFQEESRSDGEVKRFDEAETGSGRIIEEYHSIYENEIHEKIEEESELNDIFDNLGDLVSEAMRQKKEEEQYQIYQALKELKSLQADKDAGFDEWEVFFRKEEYQWAFRQGEFLYEWGRALVNKKIDGSLARLMHDVLERIIEYNQSVGEEPTVIGLMDPYQFVALKIKGAYEKTEKKLNKGIWIALCVVCTLMRIIFHDMHFNTVKDHHQKTEELIENLHESAENTMETTAKYRYITEAEWKLSVMKSNGEEFQEKVFRQSQRLTEGIYIIDEDSYGDVLLESNRNSGVENTYDQSQEAVYRIKEITVPDKIDTSEGEIILPDEAFGFVVFPSDQKQYAFLWCDQEALNMENGSVYCFDGEQYNRAWERSEDTEVEYGSTIKYSYEMLDYKVFAIRISAEEQNGFPVIFVPAE